MSKLTLEWKQAFKSKTEKILDQQPSKNPGTVRLGRHPDLCDQDATEERLIEG